MRRPALVLTPLTLFISAFAALASPTSAAASCVDITIATIDGADAAGIGTVLGNNDGFWVVDITDDRKGNLPDQIAVDGNDGDGFGEWSAGREIAALFYLKDNRLITDDCGQSSVEVLEAYQPPSATGGAATQFLGGRWGSYRTIALDGNDTPVAYGYESGRVEAMAVCPGDEHLVEVVRAEDDTLTVAVRSLSSFEVVSEAPVEEGPLDGDDESYSVECDASDGSAFTIGRQNGSDADPTGSAWGVSASATSRPATAVTLTGTPAAPEVSTLELDAPPQVGGWSPWLFVIGAVGVAAYLLKKSTDPEWRSSWNKPDNARNAQAGRRAEEPRGKDYFGGRS